MTSASLLGAGLNDQINREGFAFLNLGPLTPVRLVSIAVELAASRPDSLVSDSRAVTYEHGSQYSTLLRGDVPFHTDGLNLKEVPHYSMLYCERPADSGGETVLIRGDLLVNRMPCHIREVLTETPVRVQLAGYARMHRLIQPHPHDGAPCFLFADPELSADCSLYIGDEIISPPTLSALRALCDAAPIAHRQDWQRHDLLILDNRRILHSRKAYTGERRLTRILIAPKDAGI